MSKLTPMEMILGCVLSDPRLAATEHPVLDQLRLEILWLTEGVPSRIEAVFRERLSACSGTDSIPADGSADASPLDRIARIRETQNARKL